jgi:hypothetical protein
VPRRSETLVYQSVLHSTHGIVHTTGRCIPYHVVNTYYSLPQLTAIFCCPELGLTSGTTSGVVDCLSAYPTLWTDGLKMSPGCFAQHGRVKTTWKVSGHKMPMIRVLTYRLWMVSTIRLARAFQTTNVEMDTVCGLRSGAFERLGSP